MDYNSGTTRRSRQQNPNQSNQFSYGPYDGFNPEPQYDNQFYSGQFQPPGPQLYEDTNSQQFGGPPTFDPYNPINSGNAFGGPPFAGNASTATNFLNQQLLLTAGQQILNNPMAAAALDQYGQNLVNKGKSWIGSNLKYYFAVDTSYVLRKLLLIFFPFTHKDWSSRYNPSESVAPRDDINSPDLYIPTMAFVTYILVSGYLLGIQNRFSPEVLSIQASSALAWLILEVAIALISLYLLSISCSLGFFHMIAFGGYKFVCIVSLLLVTIPFTQTGYYVTLVYCSLSLGYFLLRSLHIAMQSAVQSESRNGLYLVLVICCLQPIVMYFLTRNFIFVSNV